MTIGNKPKQEDLPLVGKVYWWLAIGKDAVPSRFFEGGWRAFEFVVFKPYEDFTTDANRAGESHPYAIRFAFAYWLPFYFL